MKRKPKMRVRRNCGACQYLCIIANRWWHCEKKKIDLFRGEAEECQDFTPDSGRNPKMEPDPDAPENTFCFTCKWYNDKKNDAVCMLNPPRVIRGSKISDDTFSVRPEVKWDDYCSKWEKEENQV